MVLPVVPLSPAIAVYRVRSQSCRSHPSWARGRGRPAVPGDDCTGWVGVVRTRVPVLLLATGLTTVVLGGCQVDRWSSSCTTDTGLRRCEISVSGDGFHDLPFPVSGPVQGSVGDRFRLESASPGGSATFSAGDTEGGTFTCTQGQTVSVGDSSVLCRSVGDGSLDLTISRVR